LKQVILGREPNSLTLDVRILLTRKGQYFEEKGFTYIRVYGFEGKPFHLSKMVDDWFFLEKLVMNYSKWGYLLHSKKKK
jgi:hypothetical protein